MLLYSKKTKKSYSSYGSELLSLAVQKRFRKSGIAKKLCCHLMGQYKEKGARELKVVVGEKLLGAQKFYESLGAEKINTVEVHKESLSFVYRLNL